MGYTHYWDTKPTITRSKWAEFIKDIKKLYKGAEDVIRKEYNDSKKPVANMSQIRFNGMGNDGHETFYIQRVDKPASWSRDKSVVFGFCKTARKRYDSYVTASLILAKIHLGKEIVIDSDGTIDDWKAGCTLANDRTGRDIVIKENKCAEYSDSIKTAIIKDCSKIKV